MYIEIAIKLYFIIVGLFLLIVSINSLRNNKVSLTFGFLWIIFGIGIIFLGIFIRPTGWLTIMGISSLVLLGIICVFFIYFLWTILKSIDDLKRNNVSQLRTIQYLKDDNAKLKNAIASINSKVLFNSNSILYKKLNHITDSNVLFVINTMGMGGAEKQLIETLKDFIDNGNNVDLFVITSQGELIDEVPAEVSLLNNNYDAISVLDKEGQGLLRKKVIRALLHKGNIFRYFPYLVVSFFKLLQTGNIAKEKMVWLPLAMSCQNNDKSYDYAIAFTEGAATQYVSRRVEASNKYAFVHIAYDIAGYNDYIDNGAYQNINEIYAVSNEVRNTFISVHPECNSKTFIIENEINTAEILNKAQEFVPEKTSEVMIVSMGRLTEQKSFDMSILAASILKSKGVDFQWTILGDGPLHDHLDELIKKLNLEQKVILKGNVDNPYPYLKNCDIYVHATAYEGKSIALREAKILGCVTIVSDVIGNRETVIDGFDGLMCQTDPEDIAEKISTVISNPKYREYLKKNVSILE